MREPVRIARIYKNQTCIFEQDYARGEPYFVDIERVLAGMTPEERATRCVLEFEYLDVPKDSAGRLIRSDAKYLTKGHCSQCGTPIEYLTAPLLHVQSLLPIRRYCDACRAKATATETAAVAAVAP